MANTFPDDAAAFDGVLLDPLEAFPSDSPPLSFLITPVLFLFLKLTYILTFFFLSHVLYISERPLWAMPSTLDFLFLQAFTPP